MTLEKHNREDLIRYRIERAHEARDDAELNLKNGRLFTAVNRIYYAIFYVLSALALQHQFKTSKHLQLMGWFNKNFIKTGLVDKRYGQIARQALTSRMDGDYEDMTQFNVEDVQQLYSEMTEFLNIIESMILTEFKKEP